MSKDDPFFDPVFYPHAEDDYLGISGRPASERRWDDEKDRNDAAGERAWKAIEAGAPVWTVPDDRPLGWGPRAWDGPVVSAFLHEPSLEELTRHVLNYHHAALRGPSRQVVMAAGRNRHYRFVDGKAVYVMKAYE